MLQACFFQVLNQSLTGTLVILAVLALRFAFQKAPRWMVCALWAAPALRLLCPYLPESPVGTVFFNRMIVRESMLYEAAPQIHSGIDALDHAVGALLPAATPQNSVNPIQVWAFAGQWIWLLGALGMAVYALVRFALLHRRLIGAIRQESGVYLADRIGAPFVLGLFRPKIYLPPTLSADQAAAVLAHERAHIRRGDPSYRLLAYAIVCIYWFNPLVWAAFYWFGQDLEQACDASAVRSLGDAARKSYAQALLDVSAGRTALPLSFGCGDIRTRVRRVLSWRPPKKGWRIGCGLLCALALCVLCTNASSARRETMRWARQLTPDQVACIELVAMPTAPQERYQRYEGAQLAQMTALIQRARGRYVPYAQELAGGSTTLYVTLRDGTRRYVRNIGNVYLVIDGDAYLASYDDLAAWPSRGSAPLPAGFEQ